MRPSDFSSTSFSNSSRALWVERSSASTWATFRTMEASPPVGAAVLVLPEAAGVLFPPPQADR